MSTLCGILTAMCVVHIVNSQQRLSELVLHSTTLLHTLSEHFAVYHQDTHSIYSIGGNICTDCGFKYDISTDTITDFTTNISALLPGNNFLNHDSCNSVLIGDNSMIVLDWLGEIWEFNIQTKHISLRNNEKYGQVSDGCMVSNNPFNTYLYICTGNGFNCFSYDLNSDMWTQIASVKCSDIC